MDVLETHPCAHVCTLVPLHLPLSLLWFCRWLCPTLASRPPGLGSGQARHFGSLVGHLRLCYLFMPSPVSLLVYFVFLFVRTFSVYSVSFFLLDVQFEGYCLAVFTS